MILIYFIFLFNQKATFFKNKNEKFLELLGFDQQNLEAKLNKFMPDNKQIQQLDDEQNKLNNQLESNLNLNSAADYNSSVFDQISLNNTNNINNDDDGDAQLKKKETRISPIDFEFENGSFELCFFFVK
jgi:hypothetical protein